jgi:hypothetical protein
MGEEDRDSEGREGGGVTGFVVVAAAAKED